MSSTADAGSDLIIEDDDEPAAPVVQTAPWRVLIVDDDVDVHVVTKFALSNASFQGRRLSFLHAYSGKEALDILRDTPDIALVLLDVIMETDDAGLRVARKIREELGNELVRVVLRTGQPGQALEHAIIVDYDINDFWCKADLTTRKLFTTVIASLRAYSGLVAAAKAHEALNAALAQVQNVQQALDQHALVLTVNDAGSIVNVNDRVCTVFHMRRDQLLGQDVRTLHPQAFPAPQLGEISQALAKSGKWAGDLTGYAADGTPQHLRATVVAFKDADGRVYQYVAMGTLLAA